MWEALATSVISMLMPAVATGTRRAIAKWTGSEGAQPQTLSERIELMRADTARLQALAQLDAPAGPTYQWVNAIRALQRPFACVVILTGWLATRIFADYFTAEDQAQAFQFVLIVVSYLFGERVLWHDDNNKRAQS